MLLIMEDRQMKIQMLGGFHISWDEGVLEEGTKRTPKFWKVLQYLITFRHKTITTEDLVDAIWPEEEHSDPKNAMHNMIHRIRVMLLSSEIPHGKDLILKNSSGGYSWNNNLPCEVDSEEFEQYYLQAIAENTPKEAVCEMLMKAISLYKGDFLPNASYEMWVIPLASYYRTIYFKCVYLVMDMLIEQEQYSQLEMICKKALLIDQFDMTVNEYHLQALIKQEKQKTALTEYQKIAALLYEELGVTPSQSLSELYMEIQKIGAYVERPLSELAQEWLEFADFAGAYYCEYYVFKMIYQIEARSVMRSGKTVFIISITAKLFRDKKDKDIAAMPSLQDIIKSSLRKGDLFTRSAVNQFVMMLQNLTFEDCQMLSKKIASKFNQKHYPCTLNSEINPITPIE